MFIIAWLVELNLMFLLYNINIFKILKQLCYFSETVALQQIYPYFISILSMLFIFMFLNYYYGLCLTQFHVRTNLMAYWELRVQSPSKHFINSYMENFRSYVMMS